MADAAHSAPVRVVGLFGGPSRHGRCPLLVGEVAITGRTPGAAADALQRALREAEPAYVAERLAAIPAAPAPAPGATRGELLAHATLALQRWAGWPVRLARTLGASGDPRFEAFAVEIRSPAVAVAALRAAMQLLRAAEGRGGAGARLRRYIGEFVEQPVGVAFIREAEARGIPWALVADGRSVVDFGQGRHRRRLLQSFTGETSHIATVLSTRKDLAAALFRAHGLPVPRHYVVHDEASAVRAARAIGWPVVVKPLSQDFGTAVHLDLASDADVRAAYAVASRHGAALVEQQIAGDHHRMMVVNGRFLSARRQLPAHVVGDGRSSVRSLVEAANADRRARGWRPIPLDAEAGLVLSRQGIAADAVPEAGRVVRLRTQGNLSTGGTMEVVTDRVHPDNVRLALRAAQIMGIDVAGLDFIAPDIARSHLEAGGAICEINVTPGLILGEEGAILDDWFPAGGDGRIPLVVLLDPPEDGHLSVCAAGLLARAHAPVCSATRRGVWLGRDKIVAGDMAGWRGARIALAEPAAAAALVELESARVLSEGSAFDRCTVLVAPRAGAGGAEAAIRERREALGILSPGAAARLLGEDLPGEGSAACPVCAATVPAAEAALLRALEDALRQAPREAARAR
jgi:cyanophycin synthetase